MTSTGRRPTWYRYWAADGATRFHVEHEDPAVARSEIVHGRVGDLPSAGDAGDPPATTRRAAPGLAVSSGAADGKRFARAHVVVVANQKGGVGKTTTAVSLSAALAQSPSRVLLVDLDPQGNATSGLGVRVAAGSNTIYEVLTDGAAIEDAVTPTSVRNLFIVPSTLDLAGAEIELVSAFSREQKLRRALKPILEEYDIILVDCPPSLGLLTVNAFAAGDQMLVPIQCEYYALEGLGALRRNAALVQADLNPQLDIIGFVLTMYDGRTRLSQQVGEEMRRHFGDLVFDAMIPRSVRLAEAPSYGQPITVFDPASRGSVAYHRLADELLGRLAGLPPPHARTGAAS